MPALFRTVRPAGPAAEVVEAALSEIAQSCGALGVEVVDVAGDVQTVAARVAEQAETVASLSEAATRVAVLTGQVGSAAGRVGDGAQQATTRVQGSQEQVAAALDGAEALSTWVLGVGAQLEDVTRTLGEVGEAARSIDKIAGQTHILALNARIEAARSGEAGRGFTVIADSVRSLAEQTVAAAQAIGAVVEGLAAPLSALQEQGRSAGERAEAVRQGTRLVQSVLDDVGFALRDVGQSAAEIAEQASSAGEQVAGTSTALVGLSRGVADSRDELARTEARTASLLDMSERLLGATARSGARTPDTPFIEAVRAAAARVEALFAAELAAGRCTERDLFDEDYRPVRGSEPAQVTTRFTTLTDRLLPDVQEPLLALDERVVFCAAVDRNGYLPTHNRAFSKPQGPDPAWNSAHCRNRRLFADRTGLAAARNRQPFLLQTYRRDMGGGVFALMKDVSAPVLVAGRHWGAVRLAYRV
ncbi:MAG: methyl-accepting chemotaxis protein [Actinomycetota bacterium]|nr:methyl-accepting chemotaxis protein [Actinomycetota bacterium]